MNEISDLPLKNRHIAVPESRELNLFAEMLEVRGAKVLRCPLIAIHDTPDQHKVVAWLKEFNHTHFDDLILLTGEGLRRLCGFAERAGLLEDFTAKLAKVRKITRGPKPANALRKIGLSTDLSAAAPTTEGVIESLSAENLAGRKIGVQLYGRDPNPRLIDFLNSAGARISSVAPYIYATDAEEDQVLYLIDQLLARKLDAIAFTSSPQVRRLFQVARKVNRDEALRDALGECVVAAVGPVVASELREAEVQVSLMPDTQFFMKPLVRRLVLEFSTSSGTDQPD